MIRNIAMVTKIIYMLQSKVCGQGCTRFRLSGLIPTTEPGGMSVLGLVEPPAQWAPD